MLGSFCGISDGIWVGAMLDGLDDGTHEGKLVVGSFVVGIVGFLVGMTDRL